MKLGCSFGIFLNSAHLICQSTDISKCFRGSVRLRGNESRLYFLLKKCKGLFTAKAPHFFISIKMCVFDLQYTGKCNVLLTMDVVSFEQLGPE